MEMYKSNGCITVIVTGAEIQQMEQSGMVFWYTPGGSVYIDSNARFQNDVCIALPQDILDNADLDFSDGLTEEDVFEFCVEL